MIHYQLGGIDANGAPIAPPPPPWQAQCQAILPNMVAASQFWADRWSTAVRHPVAPRDLPVFDEDPNDKKGKDKCLL